MNLDEIADHIGLRNVRIKKPKKSRGRPVSTPIKAIRKHRMDGATYQKIAEKFGLSVRTVWTYCNPKRLYE